MSRNWSINTLSTKGAALRKEPHSNLRKAIQTLRKSFFSLMLLILIRKEHSKSSYCYTALRARCSTKEAITASFLEHFNEKQENTICAYFAVVI